jgi:hypothetical protein
MSNRSWFFASQGQQQGPYPEAQFREFIAQGTVGADTLVWTEGMAAWQKARDIPGLLSAVSGPPAAPYSDLSPITADTAAGQSLKADFGTWALFGRFLLYLVAFFLVIPLPWVVTGLYRWLVGHVGVPQRPHVAFAGKPGDIWYVFVILALGSYAGFFHIPYLQYIFFVVQAFLSWMIVRWFVANVSPDGQQLPLTFTGGVWTYIGWHFLAFLSFITIIGWAWVLTAWMRWLCRHVVGARRQIVFNASGWQMLWRTLLFAVATMFIIPIPWVLAWYGRWSVSQFALVERA